jgi:hypothetical protein
VIVPSGSWLRGNNLKVRVAYNAEAGHSVKLAHRVFLAALTLQSSDHRVGTSGYSSWLGSDGQAEDEDMRDQKCWDDRCHYEERSSERSRVNPQVPALIKREYEISKRPRC